MVVVVSTGKVQHEKTEPAPALVSSHGCFVSRWPLMLIRVQDAGTGSTSAITGLTSALIIVKAVISQKPFTTV